MCEARVAQSTLGKEVCCRVAPTLAGGCRGDLHVMMAVMVVVIVVVVMVIVVVAAVVVTAAAVAAAVVATAVVMTIVVERGRGRCRDGSSRGSPGSCT